MWYESKLEKAVYIAIGVVASGAALYLSSKFDRPTGTGVDSSSDEAWKGRTVSAEVGEKFNVRNVLFYYNGMVNKNTFSLSRAGHVNRFSEEIAPTTYFSSDNQNFGFDGYRFRIGEVTPEKIVLTYVGEKAVEKKSN